MGRRERPSVEPNANGRRSHGADIWLTETVHGAKGDHRLETAEVLIARAQEKAEDGGQEEGHPGRISTSVRQAPCDRWNVIRTSHPAVRSFFC